MTKLNTESAPNAEKPIIAFNAVIASNVPLGSGLSSSAALE